MVDAITSSSSLASAYAAQAAQSSLRAEAQTQNAGAATQAAQRTSGAQTNSAQAGSGQVDRARGHDLGDHRVGESPGCEREQRRRIGGVAWIDAGRLDDGDAVEAVLGEPRVRGIGEEGV